MYDYIYVYVCTFLANVLRSFTKICVLAYSIFYCMKNIDWFKICAKKRIKFLMMTRYSFSHILHFIEYVYIIISLCFKYYNEISYIIIYVKDCREIIFIYKRDLSFRFVFLFRYELCVYNFFLFIMLYLNMGYITKKIFRTLTVRKHVIFIKTFHSI